MEKYRYQLNFADTVWTFDLPVEVEVDDNCKPFVTTTEHTDVLFSYRLGEPNISNEKKVQEQDPVVWKGSGYIRVERLLVLSRTPCACYYLKGGRFKTQAPGKSTGAIAPSAIAPVTSRIPVTGDRNRSG